jgi:hypothetical protein
VAAAAPARRQSVPAEIPTPTHRRGPLAAGWPGGGGADVGSGAPRGSMPSSSPCLARYHNRLWPDRAPNRASRADCPNWPDRTRRLRRKPR